LSALEFLKVGRLSEKSDFFSRWINFPSERKLFFKRKSKIQKTLLQDRAKVEEERIAYNFQISSPF